MCQQKLVPACLGGVCEDNPTLTEVKHKLLLCTSFLGLAEVSDASARSTSPNSESEGLMKAQTRIEASQNQIFSSVRHQRHVRLFRLRHLT